MVHCENNFDSVRAVFLEPVVNHLASNYIAENWNKLERTLLTWGFKPEIASDLLQDVFEVTVKKEESGEGFNPDVFDNIDKTDPNWEAKALRLHILGRLSLTGKNPRYHSTGEKRTSSSTKYRFSTEAASASTDEEGQMTGIQWAYQNSAAQTQEFEEILSFAEIRDDIRYCISCGPKIGASMLTFFRRIEEISQNIQAIGDLNNGKIRTNVFASLHTLSEQDAQFRDSFISVMEASQKDRSGFLRVLDEIEAEMSEADNLATQEQG